MHLFTFVLVHNSNPSGQQLCCGTTNWCTYAQIHTDFMKQSPNLTRYELYSKSFNLMLLLQNQSWDPILQCPDHLKRTCGTSTALLCKGTLILRAHSYGQPDPLPHTRATYWLLLHDPVTGEEKKINKQPNQQRTPMPKHQIPLSPAFSL